jgi:carbonic anhydrase
MDESGEWDAELEEEASDINQWIERDSSEEGSEEDDEEDEENESEDRKTSMQVHAQAKQIEKKTHLEMCAWKEYKDWDLGTLRNVFAS